MLVTKSASRWTFAASALLGIAIACSDGGGEPGGGKVYNLGETAQLADYTIRIVAVSQQCTYCAPKADDVSVGVEVLIVATSDGLPVDASYAKLTDGASNSYNSGNPCCDPALQSVTLQKGDAVKQWISFELPAAASGLEFHYDPPVADAAADSVTFNLGI